ncbi:MAG: PIN domain-containing protein [Deltaproteobacteria bacterium]|nr:PIN domain-containing protein [Deltaproteobacteria bacterium]
MNRGILDTSVLIAQDHEALAAALPDEAAISVATLAELHYGVLVAKDDVTKQQRLRRLGEIEARFSPLTIDAAVARAYAAVAQAVRTAGGQPRARVMDLWIAATALARGVPLYTRNRRDFDALKKLIDARSV